jgi:hypothetical protein
VFKLIFELIRLSGKAKVFLGDSERLLRKHDPHDVTPLRLHYRRILNCTFGFWICGLIPAFLTPAIAQQLGEFKGPMVVEVATFLGLLFALPLSLYYLFAGIALGCLFAPDEFMRSPVGAKWLQLIGTTNLRVARVVCFIAVVTALAIIGGLCVFQVYMMHRTGLNRSQSPQGFPGTATEVPRRLGLQALLGKSEKGAGHIYAGKYPLSPFPILFSDSPPPVNDAAANQI